MAVQMHQPFLPTAQVVESSLVNGQWGDGPMGHGNCSSLPICCVVVAAVCTSNAECPPMELDTLAG